MPLHSASLLIQVFWIGKHDHYERFFHSTIVSIGTGSFRTYPRTSAGGRSGSGRREKKLLEKSKKLVVFKARGASITGYVIDEQRRRRQKKH
jgi:hypothetical protein